MGFERYEVGTPYQEFEKSLKPLSEGTEEIYRAYLDDFLAWNQSTPQEFYEWVRKLEADADPRAKKQLTAAFDDFAATKLEAGLSPNTVLNYRKAIHKFLEANELIVRIKKNGKNAKPRGQDIITRSQIKTLIDLSATNLRLRALLMTLKDSGLGVSEVPLLTVEDFLGAQEYKDEEGRRFKQWSNPLLRVKTGEVCEVCLGPEAITAIEDYLATRRAGALYLTSKGQPHKDEEGNVTSEAGYTEKGAPMTPSSITTSIRNHCKVLKRKGYKISAHSFRKLFETSFELEGKLSTAKMIMGKAVPPADAPYLKLGENLVKSYADVYAKHLILYDESAEVKVLREEIAELQSKSTGVERLQQKIDEMMPVFRVAQRLMEQTAERDKLREA